MKSISIIIPCYNEEQGLQQVLNRIPYKKIKANGYQLNTIVVDNNSTDNTADIARKNDVTLIQETHQGKGYALLTGFRSLPSSTDYVVIIDGDNTYDLKEIFRLIEPLESNFCDVVVGSRLHGRINQGALNAVNRLGNWFFTFLVRQFYKANITDALSGYFAMRKDVVDCLTPHLTSPGFTIEMEILTRLAKLEYSAYSVPITYQTRTGKSKLNAFIDGSQILTTFFTNLNWQPDQASDTYHSSTTTQPSPKLT